MLCVGARGPPFPSPHSHLPMFGVSAIRLYRSLLREIRGLREAPLRRKLRYNARQLWEAHREERDPQALAALQGEAAAAVRVVRWLQALPKASGARLGRFGLVIAGGRPAGLTYRAR